MINGIVQITGEMGVGKTSLALGRPDVKPNQIAVYNMDVKPYPVMGTGANRGYKHYGSYLHILQDITNVKPEHTLVEAVLADFAKAAGAKVAIFDGWEIFAKSWTSYFLERSGKYKQVIGDGTFAQMSKLGHAPKVEVSLLDELMSKIGVETIFIINHLQDEYEAPDGSDKGIKTGRKVPEASKRLEQKASMRVWLKHNPDHACPIGVVLKDPGFHKYVDGQGIIPYRLFPDRLSPKVLGDVAGKDVSLWDIIRHYTANPVGARILYDFEKATPEEFAMMSGSLTETQRKVWENNQKLALLLGEGYNEELIAEIGKLKAAGHTAMEVYNLVKDQYDVTFPKVKGTYEM
jgi:hypothetical protein